MDTTISDDAFIEAVVSAAHREVIELSEEHIFSMGQILKSLFTSGTRTAVISAEQVNGLTDLEATYAPMTSPQLNNGSLWNCLISFD